MATFEQDMGSPVHKSGLLSVFGKQCRRTKGRANSTDCGGLPVHDHEKGEAIRLSREYPQK